MGRRKSVRNGSEGDAAESIGSRGSAVTGSRASGAGRRDADWDEEPDVELDQFQLAVDQLYEKRASTREAGLSALVKMMSQYHYDDCAFREEQLTQLFLTSIRKGKDVEACLAAKALGLHVLTLGAGSASEEAYKKAEPVLEQLVLTGKNNALRVACLETLSLLCFCATEGVHETLRTMHTLWQVVLGGWKKSMAAQVVTAALRSWALLLTTVPSHRLDVHFVETHLGLLAQLLGGSDVDVRGAAGEAIALLWQLADLSSLPESPRPSQANSKGSSFVALAVGSPRTPRLAGAASSLCGAQDDADSTSAQALGVLGDSNAHLDKPGLLAGPFPSEYQQHQQQYELSPAEADRQQPGLQSPVRKSESDEGARVADVDSVETGQTAALGEQEEDTEEVDSLAAILHRMQCLAKNRGDVSRLNRSDRAASRSTFRDLLSIIEGSYIPLQKVTLKYGDSVTVSGLDANVQLNFMRAYLADAFQSHLQYNPLLSDVFNFTPAAEPEERLTPVEKRMFRSKSSSDVRLRTEQRRKERTQMATYKLSALAID